MSTLMERDDIVDTLGPDVAFRIRALFCNAVETHFGVVGSTLVQAVAHLGAAYPVVADPIWVKP